MTFYFICQDQKYFLSFTKKFSFLVDGIFVESIEHLREILKVNTEAQQFFLVHFQGTGTKTDKYVLSIREKRPHAKVVFVTQQMSTAELKAHQNSKVGADVYVDFSVSEMVFGEILDNFLPADPDPRGNRLERTGVFARKFEEADHLQQLREHTQSKQLNEIFSSVIESSKAKAPVWQSTSALLNPILEEEVASEDVGDIMSDKDHELSLENLENLEVGGEGDVAAETVLDDGFEMDDGAPDIPLDLGDDDPSVDASEEPEYGTIEAAPEPKGTSSELHIGEDLDDEFDPDEFSFSEDDELSLEDDEQEEAASEEEPLIENIGELDFSDISDISLSDTSEGLGAEASEGGEISFGDHDDVGDFSEEAKEKLKEIDAIMDLDASQTQISREKLEAKEADDALDFDLSSDEDSNFDDLAGSVDLGDLDELGDLDLGEDPSLVAKENFDLDLDADLSSGEGVGGGFVPVEDLLIEDLEFDSNTDDDRTMVKEDRTTVADEDRTMIAPRALVEEVRAKVTAQEPVAAPERAPQKAVAEEPEQRTPVFTGDYERAQATISNLRADREELLAKIQSLEDDRVLQNRQQLSLRAELDEKKIELTIIRKKLNAELGDLKEKLGVLEERKLLLEEKVKFFTQELDKAGQKNKIDVKKVQMRERELEQKLELLKSDAESQIRNRDAKILELKRRIDAMEFDMESISLQEKKSVENRFELEDKLEKAIKTLRSAITVLEDDGEKSNALDALKKNIEM